jgi:peptide chain release factor
MLESSSITPKSEEKRKIDRQMKQPFRSFNTDPEILKKQVTVETYRSSGPGGQRKNKTETSVRLKHLPSGITVVATEHRSQSQNLRLAFERLRERLERLNRPRRRRVPTRIPGGAVESRIKGKKLKSSLKRFRQKPSEMD